MFDTIAVTKTQKRVVHPGKRAAINMCNIGDDTAQVLTCAYLLTPAFSARVLRPPTDAPAQGAPFRPPLEARPPPLPRDLLPIFTGPKLVQLSSVFTRDADRYFQVLPQQLTLLEPSINWVGGQALAGSLVSGLVGHGGAFDDFPSSPRFCSDLHLIAQQFLQYTCPKASCCAC